MFDVSKLLTINTATKIKFDCVCVIDTIFLQSILAFDTSAFADTYCATTTDSSDTRNYL